MSLPILTMSLLHKDDSLGARQRARQLAGLLGFDQQDQVRIVTAVSEIVRNTLQYAGAGKVEFLLEERPTPQLFQIRISDRGNGIADLPSVLEGRYKSATGMGLGITGTRRLVDEFQIESCHGEGTVVLLGKALPARKPRVSAADLARLTGKLASEKPRDAWQELQQQNQELLRALEDLRDRETELRQVNQELLETNRGVLALYAELDERAASLQKAGEIRSRFFSHISHELRTPLNSIIGLSRLLLDEADGELKPEQRRQVSYMRQAAQEVLEMVGDVLDSAKLESGQIDLHFTDFDVTQLFATLRGMLRPLATNEAVELVFEEPVKLLLLHSDEVKVGQILRNLISNALKFTEKGYVRISAHRSRDNERVVFTVEDTGIGIRPEHHSRIFQEFAQIDNPIQRKVRGTGLGLPLSKNLAELLGGSIDLESNPGVGSTFHLSLPLGHAPAAEDKIAPIAEELESGRRGDSHQAILVIDDDEVARYLIHQLFRNTRFRILEASSGREGLLRARTEQPKLIILDLAMPGMSGRETLDQLERDSSTSGIPVIIRTSEILEPEEKRQLASRTSGVIWEKAGNSGQILELIARLVGEPELTSRSL